jgi:hypothetical protein
VTILTVPHFLNNIQDKEFLTASKRINYLISQAVGSLNVSSGITAATSPEDFVNNYLSKVLKFTKVCGYSNHTDCGFTDKIKDITKKQMDLPTQIIDLNTGNTNGWGNTNGYSFVSLNGYSMMLFYNSSCQEDVSSSWLFTQPRICINILYDINGSKSPNQVGKDIGFTTVFYPTNSKTFTPIAASTDAKGGNFTEIGTKCINYGNNYYPPNKDEIASMCFNGKLIGLTSGNYWSSSSAGDGLGWVIGFSNCVRYTHVVSGNDGIRCIKK